MHIAYIIIGVIALAGAVVAVVSKNLLQAAVALGISSMAVAVLFFMLGAPYAGGFELSVGAGLISLFFVIGISLTESVRGRRHG